MGDDCGVQLSLLGVPLRIEARDAAVRLRLRALWQPCTVDAQDVPEGSRLVVAGSRGGWSLRRGAEPLGHAPDQASLERLLAVAVNAHAIQGCSDLLVHSACVVRGATGLALAAQSGHGKSTLTAACLVDGWAYVTDEALWVQRNGSVLPYAKPLNLSSSSAAVLGLAGTETTIDGETVWSSAAFGAQACSQAIRLTDVAFLERRAAPTAAHLVPLHPADALTGLLRLSFNHYVSPADSITRLTAAVDGRAAWRLVYSDAREAAALLSERCSEQGLRP